MSDANSHESWLRRRVRRIDFAAFDEPIEVDHPQIQAVRFVTAVEDPLDGWADIFVDLKDGRSYAFTLYTPTMIAADMEEDEEYLVWHNDIDQLIVRELTVPCIVDGVARMLEIDSIDRMGVLQHDGPIQEIEWDEASVPDSGTRLILRLVDGRRYRFTAFSISSIAQELHKQSRLSFVEDGLLVLKVLDKDSIRTALEKLVEGGQLDRVGVGIKESEN